MMTLELAKFRFRAAEIRYHAELDILAKIPYMPGSDEVASIREDVARRINEAHQEWVDAAVALAKMTVARDLRA